MTKQLSIPVAALLMAALAGCAAVKPETSVPVVPPSQSVAEADARLATVTRQRAQAESEFAASEEVCYAKFLVNRCLDEAHEKRRVALSALRAIEIEAERFKRQANVDARDRAIAKAEQEFRDAEAKMAAAPPPPRAVPQEAAPKAAPLPHDRAAEQAAKLKKLDAEQKAGAAARAANVAAFEKRKRDAEQRQREIEEKKKKKISEGEAK
jgi:colicin import membrane protein